MSSLPAPSTRSARLVADLAVLHLRHDDAPRALALGLAALKFGDARPHVLLLVAQAFLRTGDAEQALAALHRLAETGPGDVERAAAALLEAKARFRQGDTEEARARLLEATAFEAARAPRSEPEPEPGT
jgi:Flp pilus assembly protein TadD